MRMIRGKKAFVTGAANGIGRALSLRLAREGADLFLIDIDAVGLEAVAAEVRSLNVQVQRAVVDISTPAAVSACVQQVLGELGSLDILVNNAGVCYYGATVNMTAEQWDRLIAIDLLAPLQFTRELLPHLLSRPEAHVLNVASIYGLVGTGRCTAYHTAKFGLVGFSEALRTEVGKHGVGVTALCPGFVRTDFFAKMPSDRPEGRAPEPPGWLCSTPDQVAAAGIRAIYRDSGLKLVGPFAYLAYYVKRLCPWVLELAYRLERRRKLKQRERSGGVPPPRE